MKILPACWSVACVCLSCCLFVPALQLAT